MSSGRTKNFKYDQVITVNLDPSDGYKIVATRRTADILQEEVDEVEKEMYLHVERTIVALRSGIERELLPRDYRLKYGIERLTPEYGVYLRSESLILKEVQDERN